MKEYRSIPTTMKKDGGSSPFIFTDFMALSISHSVKRSQKPMNMSTTNDYEGRNNPADAQPIESTFKSDISSHGFLTSSPP
jgi:hypothetical protein